MSSINDVLCWRIEQERVGVDRRPTVEVCKLGECGCFGRIGGAHSSVGLKRQAGAGQAEPRSRIHLGLELSVIAAIGGHATQFIARDPERPARVELIFSLNLLTPRLADVGRKGEQEILGNALL